METVKKTVIAAVSGVKNSGKTTFLEKMVAGLKGKGYLVAVIKHDGHEFEPDVPETDTWKLRKAGAYGTAIFSKGRWMVIKEQAGINEEQLIKMFPEVDFVLLEGFKYSIYPKFEIVRNGNSKESVCDPETLLALVTDTQIKVNNVPVIGLDDWEKAIEILENLYKSC